MAVKKSDLYSTLWASCDELRGGMEPTEYKDYVLLLLFIRYVSDKAKLSKGLITIPTGGGFDDLVKLKNKPNVGEAVNIAIAKLAEANNLHGVIDVADFNDEGKLGKGQDLVETVSKLIGVFENPLLNFANNRADGDDILGDAYEYLMRKFSIDAGKSKGQFYTPAEVSRIMSAVIGIDKATSNKQAIYDPTCGSGSLLLKAHDTAKTATGFDLAIYGQESAANTAALARMNMWLHGSGTADIRTGNTIASPEFLDKGGNGLKTFDYVVANPPFSDTKWKNNVNVANDPYKRFAYGVPPDKNGDYAFLLQILASLKNTGTGAVILPHGVLFRGNAEAFIRKNLVKEGLIKAIVGLPANLFYGTGIPACILVLDKAGAAKREGIYMIDASKQFVKDGAKNRLRERDIHKIIDAFTKQLDIEKFSRFVTISEISNSNNDYNLNLPRYIDTSERQDLQDIDGHIRGGIPNCDIDDLSDYWGLFKTLKPQLIKDGPRPGYCAITIKSKEIGGLINQNTEVNKFREDVHLRFNGWVLEARKALTAVDGKTRPRAVVNKLGELLLDSFKTEPLLDSYAIYQGFMEYWEEVLKDDLYLIVETGWLESAKPAKVLPKSKERVDFLIKKEKFHSETLPSEYLIDSFFPKEKETIEVLKSDLTQTSEKLDVFFDEFGGDEGIIKHFFNNKGRITKKDLLQAQKGKDVDDEEKKALVDYEALAEEDNEVKRALSDKESELVEKIIMKYNSLDEKTLKDLLVNTKWIGAVSKVVSQELDRTLTLLSQRLTQLSLRYLVPLPEIQRSRAELTNTVHEHLSKMGVKWQ